MYSWRIQARRNQGRSRNWLRAWKIMGKSGVEDMRLPQSLLYVACVNPPVAFLANEWMNYIAILLA
jgi:hypothetical protein